jgi:hypothetical protein
MPNVVGLKLAHCIGGETGLSLIPMSADDEAMLVVAGRIAQHYGKHFSKIPGECGPRRSLNWASSRSTQPHAPSPPEAPYAGVSAMQCVAPYS